MRRLSVLLLCTAALRAELVTEKIIAPLTIVGEKEATIGMGTRDGLRVGSNGRFLTPFRASGRILVATATVVAVTEGTARLRWEGKDPKNPPRVGDIYVGPALVPKRARSMVWILARLHIRPTLANGSAFVSYRELYDKETPELVATRTSALLPDVDRGSVRSFLGYLSDDTNRHGGVSRPAQEWFDEWAKSGSPPGRTEIERTVLAEKSVEVRRAYCLKHKSQIVAANLVKTWRTRAENENSLRWSDLALEVALVLELTAEQRWARLTRGWVLNEHKRYDEAIEELARIAPAAESNSARHVASRALHSLGFAKLRLNRKEEAAADFESAGRLKRELKRNGGSSFYAAAKAWKSVGKQERAVSAYLAAAEEFARAGAGAKQRAALAAAAAIRKQRREFTEQLRILERELASARKEGVADAVAVARNQIGNAHVRKHRYVLARPHFRAYLDHARATQSRWQEAEACYGMARSWRQNLDRARPWFAEALMLWREAGRTDDEALTQLNYGNQLLTAGRFEEALSRLRQARTLKTRPERRALVTAGVARALLALGRVDEAHQSLDGAIARARKIGHAGNIEDLLHAAALVEDARGHPRRALELLDESISSHRYVGAIVDRARLLLRHPGLVADARDRAREDLQKATDALQGVNEPWLSSQTHVAFADYHRSVPAMRNLHLIVALANDQVTANPHAVAERLVALGAVCRRMALAAADAQEATLDFWAADCALQEALRLARTERRDSLEGEALFETGRLALAQGNRDAARRALRAAVTKSPPRIWAVHDELAGLEEPLKRLLHRRAAVATLAEAQLAGPRIARERVRLNEALLATLAKAIPAQRDLGARRRLIDEAMQLVARARFDLMRDGAVELQDTGSVLLDELLGSVRRQRRELSRLHRALGAARDSGGVERADAITKQIADTQEQLGRLYLDVKAANPELGARLQFDPRELSRVARSLPDGVRLLTYFASKESLYVWVFSKDGFLEWKEHSVGRKELDQRIRRCRALLLDPKSDKELRPLLRQLNGDLLAPVADHVAASKTLYILPYGHIGHLPFEALIDGRGKSVGLEKSIVYFTSEAQLRRALTRKSKSAWTGDGKSVAIAAKSAFETLPVRCAEIRFTAKGGLGTHVGDLAVGDIWPRLAETVPCFRNRTLRRVVLTRCETGDAELLALPDAFAAAGVPVIIASHWPAPPAWDAAFARESDLLSVRRAVARKHAHPYYWAGCVQYGTR